MNERDRILVVEDEGIVAMELAARLRKLGYDVVGPTGTGEGAVTLALAERPDLVLMDVRLKGRMDGTEAAARIGKELDVPFVFLTAYSDEATIARVSQIEPHAFIIKPLEERVLAATIHLALHRHRAAKARTEAELARRRSEARYRAILDGSRDGFICIDGAGRISEFNAGAERIFGRTAEETLREPLEVLLPHALADQHRSHVARFRETGGEPRAMGGIREVMGRRSDGSVFPAEIIISRVEFEGESILTACIRDVSERRAFEERATEAHKMAAVGRLAASVAHDFNNLLTAIQANTFLLRAEAPEMVQEHIGEIGQCVDRGVALTRQLLAYSRQRPPALQILDVNELVVGVMPLLQRLVRADVALRSELTATPPMLRLDRSLIEQVLVNLVVNARDALPQGGNLIIRTGTEVVDSGTPGSLRPHLAPGPYARIEVIDAGTGVPDALLETIFEPFFTTKPEGLGTGLGLSMVRTIVRRNGGDVYVRNNDGPGATFVLLFPELEGAKKADLPRADSLIPPGNETILVVDDDVAVLRGVSQILEKTGYRVRAARTCDDALAFADPANGSLDLLLSDIVMPGCAGPDLAARIVKLRPSLPVLFMTGYSPQNVEDTAGAFGGSDVLEKPVAPLALLRAIRKCLDQRRRSSRPVDRAI